MVHKKTDSSKLASNTVLDYTVYMHNAVTKYIAACFVTDRLKDAFKLLTNKSLQQTITNIKPSQHSAVYNQQLIGYRALGLTLTLFGSIPYRKTTVPQHSIEVLLTTERCMATAISETSLEYTPISYVGRWAFYALRDDQSMQ